MMSLRLRMVIIIGIVLVCIYIINHVRRKKIDFGYALGWMVVCICILILAVWPTLLDKLAILIGVASPVNMLFFFGFILSVMIIFSLSISVSRLADKVKKLSQEIAIIRKDMHENYANLRKIEEDVNGCKK